jgi:hypothetical protein
MSAVDTIQDLLTLGVQVSSAATKSGQTVASFLNSPQFATIQTDVNNLLQSLQPNDIQSAINAIQQKEIDLLAGRKITDLSVTELTEFHALVDTESKLVTKLANTPTGTSFISILVNDVLPTLVQVAKLIIPLLT